MLVRLGDRIVALARRRFQPGAVDDGNVAARVTNEPSGLQRLRGFRYRWPSRADHFCEQLLDELEVVASRSIGSCEQPARTSLDHVVQPVAGGRLRDDVD